MAVNVAEVPLQISVEEAIRAKLMVGASVMVMVSDELPQDEVLVTKYEPAEET